MTFMVSPQESARLNALDRYQLLDTPREAEFDEVAALASAICDAPIAVINLIAADRQFFKAEVGLGVRETPLDSSFCAKAILEDDFLEVPDATLDPRFDCNPLVTGEPGFRFYAGKLLKTPEGLAIGTLCVLDTKVRVLTDLQRQALHVLGRQVMSQIELRRALAAKEEAMQQRLLAQLETSHRLKNTLAMVQAIATQTLRGVAERDAIAAFQSRLQSLAAAHDVLFKDTLETSELRTVIEGVLQNLMPLDRFTLAGPDVVLGARSALATSLIIHEFTTNAIKHGSLSTAEGEVSIEWGTAGDRLTFTWKEVGGPPVAEPIKKGFGSKLIKMGLVGSGEVSLRYDPSGFSATLTSSVEELRL